MGVLDAGAGGHGHGYAPHSLLLGLRRGRGMAILALSPATITACHRPVRRFWTWPGRMSKSLPVKLFGLSLGRMARGATVMAVTPVQFSSLRNPFKGNSLRKCDEVPRMTSKRGCLRCVSWRREWASYGGIAWGRVHSMGGIAWVGCPLLPRGSFSRYERHHVTFHHAAWISLTPLFFSSSSCTRS